jgi:hypothetical protein
MCWHRRCYIVPLAHAVIGARQRGVGQIQLSYLPPEIWCTVLEANRDQTFLRTARSINSAFRQVANRTPQLWTKLILHKPAHFTDTGYAILYLRNSGTQPLGVHINLPHDIPIPQGLSPLTVLLRPHVFRFRTLDLLGPLCSGVEFLISSIGHGQPAPLLEQLAIGISEDYFPRLASLRKAFFPSPRLVQITTHTIPAPNVLDSHLSTVTTLILNDIQYDLCISGIHILELFEVIPHLRHLTSKGSEQFELMNSYYYGHTVHMPNLVSLSPDLD